MQLPSWFPSWLTLNNFTTVSATIVALFALVRFIQGWVLANQARKIEAAKPFLELRQRLYLEALHQAAILTTPEGRKQVELEAALQRFKELYVAELSMVEPREVEDGMVQLAREIAPGLEPLTCPQQKAYDLAHSLRDTFIVEWRIKSKIIEGETGTGKVFAKLRSWRRPKPQVNLCPECGKKFVPKSGGL